MTARPPRRVFKTIETSKTDFTDRHYKGYKYQKRVMADIEMLRKQFKIRINLKKGMLQDTQAKKRS